MEDKNAYEEVLRLLPEQSIKTLQETLNRGEYEDRDFHHLHDFVERVNQASFYFENERLQQSCDTLAASATELIDFLGSHFFRIGGSHSRTCGLYPNGKNAQYAFSPETGEPKTWQQMKEDGVQKVQQLSDAYIEFIETHRNKAETVVEEHYQELYWDELNFDERDGILSFGKQSSIFKRGTNGYWLVRLMFEDKTQKTIEKEELYGTAVGGKLIDISPEKGKQFFKNTLTLVNSKIKKDLNTDKQLFSEDGEDIRRNI